MRYPITTEQIRTNISKRITEGEAELDALKGVQINTKLTTLTNRAISGKGARIGDYISIGKALYVSYAINYADGNTRYESATINAYSYANPDGSEIGTEGYMRISRTITPTELADQLKDIIESKASYLGDLRSEYRRADTIARKHNKLVEQINAFNDSITYAGEARIQ